MKLTAVQVKALCFVAAAAVFYFSGGKITFEAAASALTGFLAALPITVPVAEQK